MIVIKPHALAAFAALLFMGCSNRSTNSAHDDSGHDHDHAQHHHHEPPHGGTAVVLGDELYHLEIVRDAEAGLLTCYVLDGHMEHFVRLEQPEITMTVSQDDDETVLTFKAIANRATGETIGDSSTFRAEAEWIKSVSSFKATLPQIQIRGSSFGDIRFSFPQGNETQAH